MSAIQTRLEEGIAHLIINRPEARNALRPEMMDEMLEFLQEVELDRSIGAVVIAAVGPHFVSGGDVKGFAENAVKPGPERQRYFEALVHRMNPLFMVIERMPQIVVTSARGFVAGSGLSLVAAADIAIVSETARFSLAHIRIGGVPDAGITYYLPRQVGMKQAKLIALLGDTFDAQAALRMGLVTEVVPDDELESRTVALARRFADGPVISLGETKRLLDNSLDRSLAEQLRAEGAAVGRAVQTADFIEGATAFGERRPPRYRGC